MKRDTESSFADYLEQAKRGITEAQAMVSLMLFCGDGVAMDIVEAYQWLEQAKEDVGAATDCFQRGCDQGKPGALYAMFLLKEMTGNRAERQSWAHYLVDAAEADYVQAQCLLGTSILYHAARHGFDEDPRQAEFWLLKAVENGSTQPYTHLFHLYNEYLEPTNPQLAFRYIQLAAEEGLPSDLHYLAECYEQGRGVKKNLVEAAKWNYLNAVQYDNPNIEDLERVCSQLTKPQLEDAATRAQAWIDDQGARAESFAPLNLSLPWPEHGK